MKEVKPLKLTCQKNMKIQNKYDQFEAAMEKSWIIDTAIDLVSERIYNYTTYIEEKLVLTDTNIESFINDFTEEMEKLR